LKFSAPLCVLCHSRLIVAQLAALNLPAAQGLSPTIATFSGLPPCLAFSFAIKRSLREPGNPRPVLLPEIQTSARKY